MPVFEAKQKRAINFRRTLVCAILIIINMFAGSSRGGFVKAQTPQHDTSTPDAASRSALNFEPSTIKLPIHLDMTSIFERAESRVPREIDQSANYHEVGKDALGNLLAKYKIWRNPLIFSLNGNRITTSAHAYYWVELAQQIHKPKALGGDIVQVLGSCGKNEAPREVEVTLTTEVNWGTDWNLVSKTSIKDIRFINRCSLTAFNIDVTDAIRKQLAAKMNQLAELLDRRVRSTDVAGKILTAWNSLQTPFSLDGSNAKLSILPIDAAGGPITGSGNTISTSLSVSAFATLLFDSPAPTTDPAAKPLPPFRQDSGGNGFHIVVNALIPFSTASNELTRLLSSRKYQLGSKEIEITGAAISGSGDTALLKLTLSGGMTGVVTVRGRLRFDQAANVLSIEDIELASDGSDPLTKSFIELANVSPMFRSKISENAHWSLDSQLTEARSDVDRALNQSVGNLAILKGSITKLTILGIKAIGDDSASPELAGLAKFGAIVDIKDSFLIQITADGTAEISLRYQGY